MKASDMATFRLLRSQFHNLNFNGCHFLSPPTNCKFLLNRFPQNPQFSRHFQPPLNSRLIHSVIRRLSPESPLLAVNGRIGETPSNSPDSEPIFDQNPRVLSMFNPDSISPKTSDSEEESVENRVNSVPNYSNGPITGGSVGKGKKGKSKKYWVCSDCGHTEAKWWGFCNACKNIKTFKLVVVKEGVDGGKVNGFEVSENAMKSWLPEQSSRQGDGGFNYIAEEMNIKLPGQSLIGTDQKAIREAMQRAVPKEQRDKFRKIDEGFLGPMINYSAETQCLSGMEGQREREDQGDLGHH